MTTANGDLNQQRTVSSNTGVGVIKPAQQNAQSNQPISPNNANKAQPGSAATSPINIMPPGTSKDITKTQQHQQAQ